MPAFQQQATNVLDSLDQKSIAFYISQFFKLDLRSYKISKMLFFDISSNTFFNVIQHEENIATECDKSHSDEQLKQLPYVVRLV